MLKFALTGITSFSFVPLQLASYLGFFVSGCAFISGIYVLYLRFFTDKTIQGWTSLMIALLFLGGIQLITLGIIGEYIGRISDEVKKRPAYLIRETVNFSEPDRQTVLQFRTVFVKSLCRLTRDELVFTFVDHRKPFGKLVDPGIIERQIKILLKPGLIEDQFPLPRFFSGEVDD